MSASLVRPPFAPNTNTCVHATTDTNPFLQVDGCGPASYYPGGYKAMGAALEATGREIVYSCSWPAYIGDDESVKPFNTFISASSSSPPALAPAR